MDKAQLLLHIKANPADRDIFEFYYCQTCNEIVTAGGLFPSLALQTRHYGHRLAWLPAQDSPLPSSPTAQEGLILAWLDSYKSRLSVERYDELKAYAATTNSGNWVWVVRGDEQQDWLKYQEAYIEGLALAWLAALSGQPSKLFPKPQDLWYDNNVVQKQFSTNGL